MSVGIYTLALSCDSSVFNQVIDIFEMPNTSLSSLIIQSLYLTLVVRNLEFKRGIIYQYHESYYRCWENLSYLTFISKHETSFLLILLLALVGTEIIDISLNKIYAFNNTEFPLEWNLFSFISIAGVYVFGQFVILKYVRRGSKDIRSIQKLRLLVLHNITRFTHYALIGVLLVVILQMIFTSAYSTRFLTISIWISYAQAIFMLGFLARHFFYWFPLEFDEWLFVPVL